MPQIQLDLPEDVVEEVRRQAETRGVSVNHIVAEMVRGGRASGWPAGFFDEVVGGWKGEPLVRPEVYRDRPHVMQSQGGCERAAAVPEWPLRD